MDQYKKIHSNLIAQAAKAKLGPLGLAQKGRSRTWLDDRGWWVGVVEFQPSSWSRGSYLNVAAHWLWHARGFLSFDVGDRVEDFHEFENEAQFRPVALHLAERAATGVVRLRELFPEVRHVATYYDNHPPVNFWQWFDAAISNALCARHCQSRRWFDRVVNNDNGLDWAIAARMDAGRLLAIVEDTGAFCETVRSRVRQSRAMLKLPPRDPIAFAG